MRVCGVGAGGGSGTQERERRASNQRNADTQAAETCDDVVEVRIPRPESASCSNSSHGSGSWERRPGACEPLRARFPVRGDARSQLCPEQRRRVAMDRQSHQFEGTGERQPLDAPPSPKRQPVAHASMASKTWSLHALAEYAEHGEARVAPVPSRFCSFEIARSSTSSILESRVHSAWSIPRMPPTRQHHAARPSRVHVSLCMLARRTQPVGRTRGGGGGSRKTSVDSICVEGGRLLASASGIRPRRELDLRLACARECGM